MEHYVNRLKDNGFKLTPRRIAIIELFINSCTHLTPEEVWAGLKKQFEKFKTCLEFWKFDILTRIQLFDRKKHYGLCTIGDDHHHHHITCIKCGKVEEITDCALTGKNNIKGYRVISHFLQVDGICMRCANY